MKLACQTNLSPFFTSPNEFDLAGACSRANALVFLSYFCLIESDAFILNKETEAISLSTQGNLTVAGAAMPGYRSENTLRILP
jgi:hypothetical protein